MTEPRPRPSVIIADNNGFYRQVLGDFYREQDLDVRVAADGLEALEQVKERRPDLLVLDLIMPRFDGARLCTYLKSQPCYAGIPIIILSGILADEIDGVEEIRADAYIAKMPLEQIRLMLKRATDDLLSGAATTSPILCGFERMYRREVVQELLQERRSSRITLDSLAEGVAELSGDRRIQIANRTLQDLLGLPSNAIVAKPIDEIFPESGPLLRRMFDDLEQRRQGAEATIHRGERVLQLKLHRLDAEGDARGPAGFTLLAEDITQREKAEREREHLRSRLAESEKLAAIGMFVAGAAHELNNPLTSVLGYSQLLMQKARGTELAGDLDKVAAGAGRCKSILENLMAFARSNRPAKVPLDLNSLMLESMAAYADRLRAAGIEVDLRLAPGLPETLADPLQILQAFNGIIDNLWKALADHPGKRQAAITSAAGNGKIVIEFSDSGPGIPGEILARVFEPFFTTRQVGQGAGLGLSAAYGAVTAHAGRIQAKNRPEGGTLVTLEFPIIVRQEGSIDRRQERPLAMSPPPDERRFLIVDDEAVVRELLVDMLERPQHHIETACSGRDALRKLQEADYDVILLDLRMPDMTGGQIYEELSVLRPEMLGRVVFVTTEAPAPEVQRFLERAGNPCLRKPFARDAVMKQVQTILAAAGH